MNLPPGLCVWRAAYVRLRESLEKLGAHWKSKEKVGNSCHTPGAHERHESRDVWYLPAIETKKRKGISTWERLGSRENNTRRKKWLVACGQDEKNDIVRYLRKDSKSAPRHGERKRQGMTSGEQNSPGGNRSKRRPSLGAMKKIRAFPAGK